MWACPERSETHIFPEENVSLALHVWNAYIPRNKCEPISTCLTCIYSPKQMWFYLYMSETQIFPETHVSLSLHVSEMHTYPKTHVILSLLAWNARVPRHKCEPISTCLTCIYSPKQMWAYLYMPEMHIFPATNVSLSLHVWHACIPRNKCEPISIIHVCNAYIPRNTCEPSSTCLKCIHTPKQIWACLYMSDLHIFPEANLNVSLSRTVRNAYIPGRKCEPSSTCLKCIYSPQQMWAYLYMSDLHIFPETNVILSLHVGNANIPRNICEPISTCVWNAYIPQNTCDPISTCLKCTCTPTHMWAYLDMPDMHIFPETNVSLSLHVWHACIPRNKCEPSSTCLTCIYSRKHMWAYLYMSDMHIFPETHVSLALHVWNAYIPRNKSEPVSTCLKCLTSRISMEVDDVLTARARRLTSDDALERSCRVKSLELDVATRQTVVESSDDTCDACDTLVSRHGTLDWWRVGWLVTGSTYLVSGECTYIYIYLSIYIIFIYVYTHL